MADVSLDDYINKKNLTVQIRSVGSANTNRAGKSGFMKGRIKFTKQGRNNRMSFQKQGGNNRVSFQKQGGNNRVSFQKQGGNNRVSFQKQKNITVQKQNNGLISLQTKKNAVISLQTRKNKGLQDKSNTKPLTVTVPGFNKEVSGFNKGAFDARDRIAAAKRPQDARDKLAAKTKLSDARVKIQQIKNKQTQNKSGQIVITGLGKTINTINTNVQSSPNVTRTLNNKTNQQSVQMSGNSMTITRNVNNTDIPVNNQPNQGNDSFNFKITRTLGNRDNQQGGVKLSGNSMTITRNTTNITQPQNVQMTNTRGPVFEVTNDQYQVAPDPSLEGYYDDDEEPTGFHYNQPETDTHITEKTLTVRYPQSVRQKQTQIITTKPPVKPTTITAVKRKAPTQGPLKLSSGPLKLVGGPMVFAQPTMVADRVDVIKKPKITRTEVKQEYYDEDVAYQEPIPTMVSPLQGFKILVTNLHPVVSQDDVIELFGAVGPMKKAKLVKDGVAEVVYIQKDDAAKAIQKYHNRELDGIPMQVKLHTPKAAPPPKPVQPTPSVEEMPPPKVPGEPLKFYKGGSNKHTLDSGIDAGTLHRALFKTGVTQPSKLVTFTVKI